MPITYNYLQIVNKIAYCLQIANYLQIAITYKYLQIANKIAYCLQITYYKLSTNCLLQIVNKIAYCLQIAICLQIPDNLPLKRLLPTNTYKL